MNPRETVWRPLVQRRLLPIAIVLIAALVAIPLVLAKDPEPVATPALAPVAGAGSSPAAPNGESVVSLVGDGERTERRRVLGASKNPFEPGPAPKASPTPQPATAAQQTVPSKPVGGAALGSGASPVPGGSSAPPAVAPPVTGPATLTPTPTPPRPEYELYSLTVRFGDSSADSLERMNLARLKALPSAKDPILVYLGVGDDEKTAVFMVDAAVEPQGDGICRPSPANCETIHLREGDTEFFDVQDETGQVTAQYQLDLLDIKRKTTASAARAKASRAHVSKAGRKALRARQADAGPLRYRYDPESGTVRKLQAKAFKALVARTATATASFLGLP